MALLYDKDGAEGLFSFFPKEQAELSRYSGSWLKDPPELRKTKLVKRLKRLEQGHLDALLARIHPEWLVELLKAESAPVVAVLSRFLPTDILQGLSSQSLPASLEETLVLKASPKAASAALVSGIDPELVDALRLRLAHMLGARGEEAASPLAPLLRHTREEWETLFKDVARTELALAFYGLKQSAYRAIFHRLRLEDAKEIAALVSGLAEKGKGVDKRQQQKARMHLVSLDTEKLKPEELPLVLGMYLFSKAVWRGRDEAVGLRVAECFPLKEGRQIMALIKRHRALNTQVSAGAYQKAFLEASVRLFGPL